MLSCLNSKPRRIVLYLPNLRGGGAERVFLNLAQGFQARGHDVCLLLDQLRGDYCDEAHRHGVTLASLDAAKTTRALPRLRAWLRQYPADTLLSGLVANNINAAALKLCPEGRNMRVVISDHTIVSQQLRRVNGPVQGRILHQAMRLTYPRADAVVTVSHGVADDLCRLVPGIAQGVEVIHNPVLPDVFAPLYRQPLSRPDLAAVQRPIVLGVGRLEAQKGFDVLMQAFAHFARHNRGTLVLVGQGSEEANLRALASALGVAHRVVFAGFAEQVHPWYRWADVFALASRWEGFGNVLIEAMAAGTPVVSVNCPAGPAEILEHGKYGILVPPEDPVALAQALRDGLETPVGIRAIARKRAAEFCISRISDRYLDVLLAPLPQRVPHETKLPFPALNGNLAVNHLDLS
jgi:glycosyltransferase involved in cell wall biosynthesis